MDQRSLQWRVGVVVLSALLLTGILIVRFSEVPTPFQTARPLKIRFPQAPGVTEGTPVRKSGLLIGRVTRVDFIPGSSDVIVTLEVTNPDADLRQNEVCRIRATLLGDATLEFVLRESGEGADKSLFEIADADQPLEGLVVGNPLDILSTVETDLRGTLTSVSGAGEEIEKLAANINRLLEGDDDQRLNQLMNKTETALENFNTAMIDVHELLGDQDLQRDLKTSIAELPELVKNVDQAVSSVQSAMTRAENNLENLEGLTQPLGERGEEIAEKLDGALSDFEAVMSQLAEFTEGINSSEGTLGQLINNPELYNQIAAAAERINRITADLQPTIKSLEVFADKIARDPSQLGVSGAIRRGDRTKFTNFPEVQPPPLDWREPPERHSERPSEGQVAPPWR
ncbi:MAG: MCE family protein [Planctomycetota bacterium]|nr:MAG: MCE family protein [Planctomycetota bacterium]REJ91381.1 MAG: MCE family protein [Planctomycetota bacterium]REK18499.1 MAG: MCE family protein [Planctomycetota bacterium]REK39441.1 MAG: MCE family protein [Planctomycetota bacterium]